VRGVTPRELEGHLRYAGDGWPARQVFAILDGARDPEVHRLAQQLPGACLWSGRLAPELVEVAPYLVELVRGHAAARAILEHGWGEGWGIFFTADAELEALRRHFRRFLQAKLEDGRVVLFRYYDPAVLRAYIPTCDASELAAFFGPVLCFSVEDEEGWLLRLWRGPRGLRMERLEETVVDRSGSYPSFEDTEVPPSLRVLHAVSRRR
jgi:hypothetical protein